MSMALRVLLLPSPPYEVKSGEGLFGKTGGGETGKVAGPRIVPPNPLAVKSLAFQLGESGANMGFVGREFSGEVGVGGEGGACDEGLHHGKLDPRIRCRRLRVMCQVSLAHNSACPTQLLKIRILWGNGVSALRIRRRRLKRAHAVPIF